jgi:protein-tyrosine-phosphatase
MAEAIANQDAGDIITAVSAGLFPLGMIPELTRRTLESNGYSAQGLVSKGIGDFAPSDVGRVINMSGQSQPLALEKYALVENWLVADPYGADEATYQRILEEIQRRVRDLANRLRQQHQAAS